MQLLLRYKSVLQFFSSVVNESFLPRNVLKLISFLYTCYFTAPVRRKAGNCCGFVPVSLPAGLFILCIIFLILSRDSFLVV